MASYSVSLPVCSSNHGQTACHRTDDANSLFRTSRRPSPMRGRLLRRLYYHHGPDLRLKQFEAQVKMGQAAKLCLLCLLYVFTLEPKKQPVPSSFLLVLTSAVD
jgi:hypothetical protein